MTVLAVLTIGTLLARLAGVLGVSRWNTWRSSVRAGLSLMLLFTASAHFTSLRHDLARMVPSAVPYPMAVIYFTGVCEILGAIGLQMRRVRFLAGVLLIIFFILVLPANIYAANAGLTLNGAPVTPLIIRIPMQLLFIALTWWTAVSSRNE
jgi:uncharacterized membrane protein